MVRWARLGGSIAVLGAMVISPNGHAAASDEAPPIDEQVLAAIRAEIPEYDQGELDLDQANDDFDRLVTLLSQSTTVASFGDGSQLTGFCGGYAYSYDQDGKLLDAALDVGDDGPPIDLLDGVQAFTSGNSFQVDTQGVVAYFGFSPQTGDGPLEHSWFIKTSRITLADGSDPNTPLDNREAGRIDLRDELPVAFSAKIKVEGEMTSSNQPPCIGRGHVDFIGNGLTGPVGLVALVLLGGGLLGLLLNARPTKTYKR
jgi:hypothetical protein